MSTHNNHPFFNHLHTFGPRPSAPQSIFWPTPAPQPSFIPSLMPAREELELPQSIKALLARPVSYYAEQASRGMAVGVPMLTHLGFALDYSGSMAKHQESTINGYNEQVKAARAGAQGAGETRFTETFFADQATVKRIAVPLDSLRLLDAETYRPTGGTALFDGLGLTISALLQTPEIDHPNTACMVTLFTDGGENNSRQFDASTLREVVLRLEATKRWSFALVGPDGGIQALAQLLAVRPGNVAGYDPTSHASREQAFTRVSAASTMYMSARACGATSVGNLYAG